MLAALRSLGQPWATHATGLALRASAASSRPPVQSRILPQLRSFHATPAAHRTLNQSCRNKHQRRSQKSASPLLENSPQRKGVCSEVFVAKPKKPNSGKRKVARVKLSTGKSCMAYIMGEGHNLQEHSVVLVRGGRAQDLPGVQYKIVRGTLDLGGVVNRMRARSRYGVKKPKK
ncbi:unnamed protein product [Mycena citricolor]|uniref:Ribosomal protein S12 n=1 Tax=Mycena citricolor TaxID=2018698 RepID=A0AAD2HY43_9AGAR|nr:unnamed protein product [Mycena citricolor]